MSLGLGLALGTSRASSTVAAAPSLSGSLPIATNGVAYSAGYTLTGGQAPVTYSLTAGTLPTGLTLNTATGVISGTSTVYGDFPITITVTDALSRTDSRSQTLSSLGVELWPGFGSLTFFNQRATTTWTASAATTLNNFYLPTAGSVNFDYQCTTAGTNAASEPTWPTVAGQTVTSGTSVYTAVTKQVKQDANGAYFTAAGSTSAAAATSLNTEDSVTYRIIFTVANFVGGQAKVFVYGNTTLHSAGTTVRTANGTYTEDLATVSGGSLNRQIRIQSTGAGGTNTFDVTFVSVRRVA
jgi:hypothetical protein